MSNSGGLLYASSATYSKPSYQSITPSMGDYWTVSSGIANHTGHTCRECRQTIYINTPIYVRDGRKIRLFYHEDCFSGESDPRTQSQSSILKWEGGLSSRAPSGKGYGKWWTSGYGYAGSLQNGGALASIQRKKKTASWHETVEPTTAQERRTNASLVLRSTSLKDGRRSSSPSFSESAILGNGRGNGFQRRYSLTDSLRGLEITKDVKDRPMKNHAGKQKAVVEEGQSSGS